MRLYETTFIVNPQSDDATIDRQVTAIIDLIKKDGGSMVHEDRMGTRRLAYQIENLTQGYYACLLYNAEASTPPIIERFMRLDDAYVRHLTIVYEGDPNEIGKPREYEREERSDRRGDRDDNRDRYRSRGRRDDDDDDDDRDDRRNRKPSRGPEERKAPEPKADASVASDDSDNNDAEVKE